MVTVCLYVKARHIQAAGAVAGIVCGKKTVIISLYCFSMTFTDCTESVLT